MAAEADSPIISGPDDFARHFKISRETLDRLQLYEALLRQWQSKINLIAPGTLGQVWHRHFADSAQLLRYAPLAPTTWIDLGSGAGFPGLVVAILLAEKTQCRVALVESDTRKAAFLSEVARRTGVAVEIAPARIENPATQGKLSTAEIVSARALAPLDRLLELAAPYFSPATVGLFLKGREVKGEIEAAERKWKFAIALHESLTDNEGRIAVVSGLARRRP